MSRRGLGGLLLGAFLWAQSQIWPGRILFELKPEYSPDKLPVELMELRGLLQVTSIQERFPGLKAPSPIYVAAYQAPIAPTQAAKLWARSPAVLYAEPEYVPQLLAGPDQLSYTPNDPLLSQCYSLTHLHVLQAWDSTQGDTNFVWAVVDTDVRFDHPDLVESIAYNWADPINGIDDDNDGYVDNFHGWDLVGPTYTGSGFTPDNDPRTSSPGHGTLVAGFGGATPDNGIGAAGPAFKCRLLPIKAAPDDSWALYAAYDGLLYAAQRGAKVINASWGSTFYSQAADNFVRNLTNNHDALIVAAAGNIPPDVGTKFYPAMYDGVLSVTAVNPANDIWPGSVQAYYGLDVSTSGWGASTAGLNGYGVYAYATSFAAPQAAGCAILLRSWRPTLNARQIAELLRITGDSVDHVNPTLRYRLGRRINLHRAVATRDTPACRIKVWEAQDGNDSLFFVGETLAIRATYINYLSPVQNLSIKLVSLSPYIEVIDSVYQAGNLSTLGMHVQAQPFRVRVANGTPVGSTVPILWVYSGDGGYLDYEVQELMGLNPPYVHLPSAQLRTTIGGNGRFGYYDNTPQNRIGVGAVWRTASASWLFEGGLVLADTTAHLCTRGPGGGMYRDFLPTSPAQRTYTSLYEVGAVESGSDAAMDPAPLPFAIRLKTYGLLHEPANPFIAFVYEVENFSGQAYTDLALGWWMDWDVGNNPLTDVASVDQTYRMVYAQNGTSRYAGALLLSSQTAVLHVGRVDTFIGTRQHYQRIFQGLGTPSLNAAGDVFTAISAKGISLPAGAKDTVVLALIAGDSWAEFLQHADAAIAWYQCFLQQNPTGLDLGPDRSLCLGDSLSIPGFVEYYWNTGAYTSAVHPTQSGTYSVLVRDANGCWDYDEVRLTVNSLLPANVQFNPGLSLTVGQTLSGIDSGPTYDRLWRIEAMPSWMSYTGASFSHVFNAAGSYRIRLIREETASTCRDSLEWIANVGTTGHSQVFPAQAIQVYPNPTSGWVVVSGVAHDTAQLELRDVFGRLLWSVPLSQSPSIYPLPASLPAGTYIWKVGTTQGLLIYTP